MVGKGSLLMAVFGGLVVVATFGLLVSSGGFGAFRNLGEPIALGVLFIIGLVAIEVGLAQIGKW